jgi:hypothetical protein
MNQKASSSFSNGSLRYLNGTLTPEQKFRLMGGVISVALSGRRMYTASAVHPQFIRGPDKSTW